jgi:hypothetical protein
MSQQNTIQTPTGLRRSVDLRCDAHVMPSLWIYPKYGTVTELNRKCKPFATLVFKSIVRGSGTRADCNTQLELFGWMITSEKECTSI